MSIEIYFREGFFALTLLGLFIYTLIAGCVTNYIYDKFCNDTQWHKVSLKLNVEERNSIALLIGVLWIVYWPCWLIYKFLRWIVVVLIGLVKIIIN